MWDNPYYFFRIPHTDRVGNRIYKEIIVNVIQSAKYRDPKKDLRNVLDVLIGYDSEYAIKSVLDFGCGKLRTVNFVVNRGKKNVIVDYKDILAKHKYLQDKLKNLEKNKLFTRMNFPLPFINDTSKFDLCLLINVLPIMPVFLERLLVLQILHEKITNKKFLLWYAMSNATVYKKRERTNAYTLGDGMWIGKGKYKTFYKYHPPDFITLLMYLSGFHLERIFKVSSVDALLYRRTHYNLFEGIITRSSIEEIVKSSMVIENGKITPIVEENVEVNPFPDGFNIYNIIRNIFENLPTGREESYPNFFKRLIAGIFQFIFFKQLMEMEIEDPIDDGQEFVDITFQTTGVRGFFTKLQETYKVMCPIIFIECKNKGSKLTNTEYQQLYYRFDDFRGKFGIIVCRDKVDEKDVLSHTKPKIKKGYYVIVLDEKDILKLLKLKLEDGEEAVNVYFERKKSKNY